MKSRRYETSHTIKLTPLLPDVEDLYRNEQFPEVASSFYNTFSAVFRKMK
jgi:hypothetical protein